MLGIVPGFLFDLKTVLFPWQNYQKYHKFDVKWIGWIVTEVTRYFLDTSTHACVRTDEDSDRPLIFTLMCS